MDYKHAQVNATVDIRGSARIRTTFFSERIVTSQVWTVSQ